MSVLSPVIDRLDLSTKHIYLLAGTREYHPVSDIYVEVRNIRRLDESMRVFDMPVTAFGAVPKGGGKYTSRYTRFNHGWTVVPEDITHSLYVTGEQITDDGQSGPACIDTSTLSAGTSVIIQYEPPASELVKAEDELIAIQRMAFDEVISVNVETGTAGTEWPIGTLGQPVDNLGDALTISDINDIFTLSIIVDTLVDSGGDYRGMTFIGASKTKTTITVSEAAQVNNCEFYDAHIKGTLDGDSTLKGCVIDDLNYVTGYIEECVLDAGTILLGAGATAHFLDCWSGVPGVSTPTINMGGAGQALAMRNYNGGIAIINKTGTESVSLDLNSGQVKLDLETVTNGTIVVRGIGKVVEMTTGESLPTGYYGSLYILNEAMNRDNIASAVLDATITDHQAEDTVGNIFMQIAYGGKVFFDSASGNSGDMYPIGTSGYPVDNIVDALTIAQTYNCKTIHLHSDVDLTGVDVSELNIEGHTQEQTITCSGTGSNSSTFKDVRMTGSIIGRATFSGCHITNLSGVAGFLDECQLEGTIELSNATSNETLMHQCSAVDLAGPTIDTGTESLIATQMSGRVTIAHVTSGTVGIGGDFCQVVLDETCTGGVAAIGTKGTIINNSQGTVVALENALTVDTISTGVWEYELP